MRSANGLLEEEMTNDYQLLCVNGVLKSKLLESEPLVRRHEGRFGNSPTSRTR
ncbi:hypothetical protein QFZ91_003816 [Paraburkholderia sp. JPY419]